MKISEDDKERYSGGSRLINTENIKADTKGNEPMDEEIEDVVIKQRRLMTFLNACLFMVIVFILMTVMIMMIAMAMAIS